MRKNKKELEVSDFLCSKYDYKIISYCVITKTNNLIFPFIPVFSLIIKNML